MKTRHFFGPAFRLPAASWARWLFGCARKPTRFYGIQLRNALSPATPWLDYFILPLAGAGNVGFNQTSGQDYYRVRALKPLSP